MLFSVRRLKTEKFRLVQKGFEHQVIIKTAGGTDNENFDDYRRTCAFC